MILTPKWGSQAAVRKGTAPCPPSPPVTTALGRTFLFSYVKHACDFLALAEAPINENVTEVSPHWLGLGLVTGESSFETWSDGTPVVSERFF